MKTQNPFTGRSSGSLANVTASTYLGQNILKSKPLEVRNPQSPKQINVRHVLAQAAALGKSLSAGSGIAKRSARTGRNTQKTARTALLAAILAKKTGVAPNVVLSAQGIRLQGSGISAQEGITASINHTTRLLDVTWSDTIPAGGSETDTASVALFDLDSGKVLTFQTSDPRADGELSTRTIDSSFLGSENYGLFLMFDSADGLRYDDVVSVNLSVV